MNEEEKSCRMCGLKKVCITESTLSSFAETATSFKLIILTLKVGLWQQQNFDWIIKLLTQTEHKVELRT